jgi:alpha-amylase/alpha-mannosidase (GH57 family)
LLLSQYPKLHQTVNLVPSLILQLEDYVAGTATDSYLEASLTDTKALTLNQRRFILEHFFDAHRHTLIDPHPRYAELYQQRLDKGVAWCLQHWTTAEFGDLQAWHNLAWIDPLFWDDAEIDSWFKQGRDFTLGDRHAIWRKQQEILSRIIPQHRRMQEAGQLDVITSPYTHPILPLLADTQVCRVAIPQLSLPQQRFQWPEDITRQLEKAKTVYRDRFDRLPQGLWPSEQSVSPAILPEIARQGFHWLCSDEAVLGWTLHHFFHRDATGTLYEPEVLYQPYRLSTPHGDLAIVFRDHRLSDLIGFTYSALEPKQAASDLIGHLEAIARSLKNRQGGTALDQPWLVTIALDGENCWEFYPQDGKPFLEILYHRLSHNPHLKLVTVSEFLHQFPPTATLPADRLHSGSWVDGSFTTWIGDPAKNRAWDLLTVARQYLAQHPNVTEATHPEAWEALDAAEGSDWFWWLGAGHSSNQDAMFDELFRQHLMQLYQALKAPIPEALHYPIELHEPLQEYQPRSFIHPHVEGRGDEQDWDKAGRIEVGARGTMHRASTIQRLWYGVNHLNFYLRLDFSAGVQMGLSCPPELNFVWFYPGRPMPISPVPLLGIPNQAPLNYLFHNHLAINLVSQTLWFQEAHAQHHWQPRPSRAHMGLGQCLEVAVPWTDLPAQPDWSLRLMVVLSENGHYCDYLPSDSLIPLEMP